MEPTFDTCPEEPFRAGPGPATGRAVLGRRNAGPSAGLRSATSLVSSPFQVSRPRVIIAAYVMTGIWSVAGGHDSSSRWSDGASPTGFRPLSHSPWLLYFRYSRRREPTVKHHKAPSTPLRRCRRRAVGTPHRRERLRLVHDSQLLASPLDDGQASSTAGKPVYGLAIRYDWFRARAGSCKRSDRL
jgi:hypothetical protein